MIYGGDYNPEQWPEEVWVSDVALMREAGVNLVSLGVFAWSRIQPAEGEFDWVWLDRVMSLLHEGGVGVNLATATASPPPWAIAAYPDMLPVDRNGTVLWPGSRQHYAPTSPDYRRLAADLVRAIAERYAHHPAVRMWHVNNEYGCHVHYDYSDRARDAFRVWLRDRYGAISTLNEAWGTDFWSQRLGSFDEVFPPRAAPYSTNPAGLLDFKRFTSDALLELYVMERDIIRATGSTMPITTNFMGAHPPLDYWKWAAEVDVVADDSYPDPNDPEAFREAAFNRDLMRSLKPGVPWILMEQASNAVNWRPSNAPKAPGQMAALSMQAVGRGAGGVMFFQWRQSRRGSEKFHSAMLPHAGTATRTWREVVQLGADLAALPELPVGSSDAEVAIVFDWENWWALDNPDHPVAIDYRALVHSWHASFHRQHVQVDLVQPTGDLSGYRLVVAPSLYLLTDAGAANLRGFVEDGGQLLVTAFSDVVDENDAFRPGGFLAGLGKTLGVELLDFGALAVPGSAGPGVQEVQVDGPTRPLVGHFFAEEIVARGAEVLGVFSSGRARGRPAFTVNASGQGAAYYLATHPGSASQDRLVGWLAKRAGIEAVLDGASPFVEACRRGDVLTLINHSEAVETIEVVGSDLLTGRPLTEVTLDPYAWVALGTTSDSTVSTEPLEPHPREDHPNSPRTD